MPGLVAYFSDVNILLFTLLGLHHVHLFNLAQYHGSILMSANVNCITATITAIFLLRQNNFFILYYAVGN